MKRNQFKTLQFPIGGQNIHMPHTYQPPYTTPLCLNVLPGGYREDRIRGGSRPPLYKYYSGSGDLSSEVNLIQPVTYMADDGTATHVIIVGASGIYIGDSTSLSLLAAEMLTEVGGTDYMLTEAGGTMEYESSVTSLPANTVLQATVFQQNVYVAGTGVPLLSGSDGTVAGTTFDDVAGTAWYSAGVRSGQYVVEITAASGYESAVTDGVYRIASANDTSITLESDPGTGNCSYRILIPIYKINPKTQLAEELQASRGTAPHGCKCICTYRDRLVCAGDTTYPHVWYMSRAGDPTDWAYGDRVADVGRAVAATGDGQNEVSQPITALIPRQDDYLVVGTEGAISIIRGDPAYGGTLTQLTDACGILDKEAWCEAPDGAIYFMSTDGLYRLPPGATTKPQHLSREKVGDDLSNLSPATHAISLSYDVVRQGVWIFAAEWAGGGDDYGWFFDERFDGFWPMEFGGGAPFCSVRDKWWGSDLILFGTATTLAHLRDDMTDHDEYLDFASTAIVSYVEYGPFRLGARGGDGLLQTMVVTMDEDCSYATWQLQCADTAEATSPAGTGDISGTLGAGLNDREIVRARGKWAALRVSGGSSAAEKAANQTVPWSAEDIEIEHRILGKQRSTA